MPINNGFRIMCIIYVKIQVIVGRIGRFKSDTIFLPSISDIALQTGNRRREGGVTKETSTTLHFGASYTHMLISRELLFLM